MTGTQMDFNYVVMPIIIFAAGVFIIWLCSRRILALSKKAYGPRRKIVERGVLSIVILVTFAIAGYSAFNAIAVRSFWSRNPAPGRIVDVGGYGMHINCTGNGSPVLILEAGGQNDSTIWRGVQPALAKTTTVCAYDRAGFGWSDTQPGPRDADHIAAELHQLLLVAGIKGPIVLMGHSIGGLFIRDYATHYPADVAGLVFVDSSTPFQERNAALVRATPAKTTMDKAVDFVRQPWTLNLLVAIGVPRLLGMCGKEGTAADHVKKIQAEDICRLRKSAWDEVYLFDPSSQQTVKSGPFGVLPILILSRDISKGLLTTPSQTELDQRNAWNQMQEDLKKLSTRSRRIIAKNSSHHVMLDRPDLIEREVPLFIEQIRGSAPQPPTYGTTETE
jgi:pimeloyl-ACP methyl ester carboxylesterase